MEKCVEPSKRSYWNRYPRAERSCHMIWVLDRDAGENKRAGKNEHVPPTTNLIEIERASVRCPVIPDWQKRPYSQCQSRSHLSHGNKSQVLIGCQSDSQSPDSRDASRSTACKHYGYSMLGVPRSVNSEAAVPIGGLPRSRRAMHGPGVTHGVKR